MTPPGVPGAPGFELPPIRRRHESISELESAIDAGIARDQARDAVEDVRELTRRVNELTLRVVQLEAAGTRKSTATGHRVSIYVTVLSIAGSLVVGIILWALNFATTTKKESVSQSTQAATQEFDAKQDAIKKEYLQGVTDGADAALARLKKQQQEQDLVTVPRNVLKANTKGKP